MRKALSAVLFILLLGSGLTCTQTSGARAGRSASPAEAPPAASSPSFAETRSILEREVAARHVAGAVGLVAQEGKIIFEEAVGYRDIEADKPMRVDTLFRIASMTKPITSVGIMILYEEGKIRLDDPVWRFVPEFKNAKVLVPDPKAAEGYRLVPAKKPITIHHLLTHTSGLTYRFLKSPFVSKLYAEAGISDGLVETPGRIGDMAKRLAELPLVCQPGERWHYGLSTDVLGYVIEVASGMSLDRFFKERIFDPLGMKDTAFYPPASKLPRLAAVYTPRKDNTIKRIPDGPVTINGVVFSASYCYRGPQTYYSGGAGLVSTARDYFRFCQMLLNGGSLGGVRILKPETVRLMTTNRIGDLSIPWTVHGDKFGYGFGVFSSNLHSKRGEAPGTFSWGGFFYTDFWIDPGNKLVGILLTQLYPQRLSLRDDFRASVYKALKQKNRKRARKAQNRIPAHAKERP